MNFQNMKTTDSEEKKFRELSEEELEKVNGGARQIKLLDDIGNTFVIKKCPVSCDAGYHLEDCKCVRDV